jgi:hypothetical protein
VGILKNGAEVMLSGIPQMGSVGTQDAAPPPSPGQLSVHLAAAL